MKKFYSVLLFIVLLSGIMMVVPASGAPNQDSPSKADPSNIKDTGFPLKTCGNDKCAGHDYT